jgi:hypothetical protein
MAINVVLEDVIFGEAFAERGIISSFKEGRTWRSVLQHEDATFL